MTDPCYELIADRVKPNDWQAFATGLAHGFQGFPSEWALPAGLAARLTLKLQWQYFNPDTCSDIGEKRARSWAYMVSFLGEGFRRKFGFLRERLGPLELERWDRGFADFETLLMVGSMDEAMQLDWLSTFDAKVRYGQSKRVKVIKSKGLGLTNDVLGVHPLMNWNEIRARYRFLLKIHHPDVGGDPAMTQALIRAFEEIKAEIERRERRRGH
ncbi:J domain-containing protein [Sulfidibacter corallicola]|uniref:J domain-containing protein n=1 Tax=Sulfidibacter corallicola TaxID=2818388 RepID=A0A8A4TQN4_SULCO|nr:J domain-containing protein [Sulfidibacter corallicola]QTD52279.1 J domain-containing protein [Sulfidibacter corallicola]